MTTTDLAGERAGGSRTDGRSRDDAWAVMERFYAAEAAYVAAGGFGKADYDEVASYLDPEVVLHQAPGLPFTGTGTWRGREGMERFLAAFSEVWESMEFLEQEHWGDGDTVVVRNRVRFRARATGREVDTLILQLITVRNGRMLECRPFYWDPTAVADVCAYRPAGDGAVGAGTRQESRPEFPADDEAAYGRRAGTPSRADPERAPGPR